MAGGILIFGAALAAYLLFAGTATGSELAAGCVASSLAMRWFHAVRGRSPHAFALGPRDAAAILSALARLAPSLALTGRAVLRAARTGRLDGCAKARCLQAGPQNDPRARANGALAVIGVSLTPDSIVLRLAPGRNEMLVHAVEARDMRGERVPAR